MGGFFGVSNFEEYRGSLILRTCKDELLMYLIGGKSDEARRNMICAKVLSILVINPSRITSDHRPIKGSVLYLPIADISKVQILKPNRETEL